MSVRPSKKSFSDSDEIWYVGRGRWVMHDGMPYDPIQGQGNETFKALKLEILHFFKSISSAIFNVSWQMTTDSETTEQYLNFVRTRFLISVPVFFFLWLAPTYWHANIARQITVVPRLAKFTVTPLSGISSCWNQPKSFKLLLVTSSQLIKSSTYR